MVKILAAADMHGSYAIAQSIAQKAQKYDVDIVLLAGDIHGNTQGEGNILNVFLEAKQNVFFIPGNWDSTLEHELLSEKVTSLHNRYVVYNHIGIAGFGCMDMKLQHTPEDFKNMKSLLEKMRSEKTIFVSHLHAAGSKAEFSGIKGDECIRRVIDECKPTVVISGHIHEGEGIEERIGDTQVFQVGRSGKIFEL